MKATADQKLSNQESEDTKVSSRNHSKLQSQLAFLLRLSYRTQYSVLTNLDLSFANGKISPDLCIFPKQTADWLNDEPIVHDVPLTIIEILFPDQSLNSLLERIYKKHFPAGVKTVWLIIPALQIVSILLPNRKQINFTEGTITDPETGIQLQLAEIFEG
ncbi:Uma2 family endonuclease [Larkinella humicola]|nr:Uma2 family endonuclease [Larkinella humicola]